MGVRRLERVPGFNIDRVAAAAGDDPDVLRLEYLDPDIRPPAAAMEPTGAAIGEDAANSWLPFTGRNAAAARRDTAPARRPPGRTAGGNLVAACGCRRSPPRSAPRWSGRC
jgi:hypothetical protein